MRKLHSETPVFVTGNGFAVQSKKIYFRTLKKTSTEDIYIYIFKRFPRIVILLYFRKKLTKLLDILMGIIIPFQVQKSAAIIT